MIFAPTPQSLILYQIIATTALIVGIFVGSVLDWTVSFIIYLILVTVGGSVTYHRLLSHRSFKTTGFFEKLGSFLGSLGGNGSTISWVAIHREHHRHTDTDSDPHCPSHRGLLWVQFASMLHSPKLKYVTDLLRSQFHNKLHQYYWLYNLSVIAIITTFFGIQGAIFYYFIPTLLVWHAGSLINTVNHMSGYQLYSDRNHSTNNWFTGLFVSGEGWHNNHHHAPTNPKFGCKWWEFDLGYQIIKLIKTK
jgi:fatty-acid desaturase